MKTASPASIGGRKIGSLVSPILGDRVRKVIGLDTLARLRDNDGWSLYPDEFLPPLATDYLTNLSRLVLTQVLADLLTCR
ncbi:hypothetical protein TPL01_19310 [Sulfuriferula plumbiphila]|uniref:Uncharacterized protein n=1 Tax=Sulfuriferula plumbiphila TaxID=171865 RepID=A0A512L8K9_9PROT|nr:hypothetical protein TPL01_19310 [Sulfuriferula plumbiphila]